MDTAGQQQFTSVQHRSTSHTRWLFGHPWRGRKGMSQSAALAM